MSINQKVHDDMVNAMKAKESDKLSVLRMLSTALKNEAIKEKKEEVSDEVAMKVIKGEVKKRKDSVELYEKGGRNDLADAEKNEIIFLEEYLPEQISEQELEMKIEEVLANMSDDDKENFGKAMGMVMKELGSSADGNLVRQVLQNKINS